MAKLVFKLNDSEELDYPLNAPLIRLGRDEMNNIVIDNSWISSFHATFYRSLDGRLQVEDRNSSNGTYVNGQRIRALKTHSAF
jgi:pSer/pThr/pTyr-binding forkhead associated (FHA) protein